MRVMRRHDLTFTKTITKTKTMTVTKTKTKVLKRLKICVIFEKQMVQGYQI